MRGSLSKINGDLSWRGLNVHELAYLTRQPDWCLLEPTIVSIPTFVITGPTVIGVASYGALGHEPLPLDFQLVILGITRFTDSDESCARFSVQ